MWNELGMSLIIYGYFLSSFSLVTMTQSDHEHYKKNPSR